MRLQRDGLKFHFFFSSEQCDRCTRCVGGNGRFGACVILGRWVTGNIRSNLQRPTVRLALPPVSCLTLLSSLVIEASSCTGIGVTCSACISICHWRINDILSSTLVFVSDMLPSAVPIPQPLFFIPPSLSLVSYHVEPLFLRACSFLLSISRHH